MKPESIQKNIINCIVFLIDFEPFESDHSPRPFQWSPNKKQHIISTVCIQLLIIIHHKTIQFTMLLHRLHGIHKTNHSIYYVFALATWNDSENTVD